MLACTAPPCQAATARALGISWPPPLCRVQPLPQTAPPHCGGTEEAPRGPQAPRHAAQKTQREEDIEFNLYIGQWLPKVLMLVQLQAGVNKIHIYCSRRKDCVHAICYSVSLWNIFSGPVWHWGWPPTINLCMGNTVRNYIGNILYSFYIPYSV